MDAKIESKAFLFTPKEFWNWTCANKRSCLEEMRQQHIHKLGGRPAGEEIGDFSSILVGAKHEMDRHVNVRSLVSSFSPD